MGKAVKVSSSSGRSSRKPTFTQKQKAKVKNKELNIKKKDLKRSHERKMARIKSEENVKIAKYASIASTAAPATAGAGVSMTSDFAKNVQGKPEQVIMVGDKPIKPAKEENQDASTNILDWVA